MQPGCEARTRTPYSMDTGCSFAGDKLAASRLRMNGAYLIFPPLCLHAAESDTFVDHTPNFVANTVQSWQMWHVTELDRLVLRSVWWNAWHSVHLTTLSQLHALICYWKQKKLSLLVGYWCGQAGKCDHSDKKIRKFVCTMVQWHCAELCDVCEADCVIRPALTCLQQHVALFSVMLVDCQLSACTYMRTAARGSV
jgi:hypothetical protein